MSSSTPTAASTGQTLRRAAAARDRDAERPEELQRARRAQRQPGDRRHEAAGSSPAVTTPSATARRPARAGVNGARPRPDEHERAARRPTPSRSQAAPSGPTSSNRPTDAASPSWTQTHRRHGHAGAGAAPAGGVAARRVMSPVKRTSDRSVHVELLDIPFDVIEQWSAMDTRRLRLLLELSRRGSMRAVADELGFTTSTVSQQLAVLAREAGATLIEPDGRRVRLTPAGRRLAEHAVTILAARRGRPRRPRPRTPSRPGRCASPGSPPPCAARCCRSSPSSRRATRGAAADPRARAGRGVRAPGRRRRRPRARLRLQPRAGRARPDAAGHAAVVGGVGARRARGRRRPRGAATRPPCSARTPNTTGSSTRATPPTSRSSARSPRSPASSRGSRTASDSLELVAGPDRRRARRRRCCPADQPTRAGRAARSRSADPEVALRSYAVTRPRARELAAAAARARLLTAYGSGRAAQ